MSAMPDSFPGAAANDADAQETREGLDALSAVIETEGRERGHREEERAVEPWRGEELAHRRPRSIPRLSSITAASKRAPRSSKFRNMSKLAQPGERRTTPPGVAWDRAMTTASSRVFARVDGTEAKARSSLDVASPT